MFTRYFMIFSSLLLVSACTGTTDKGDIDTSMNDGVIIGQENMYVDSGAEPGTQADLVVNVGDRIFFETDSSDLTMSARTILENQASWLGQYSNLRVYVEGHADERGTREYNIALGDRRAHTVKNYLTALGVSPTRVETISYGKERPAISGANNSSWSQNRRGVTRVQ